jgi:hypothetical protein
MNFVLTLLKEEDMQHVDFRREYQDLFLSNSAFNLPNSSATTVVAKYAVYRYMATSSR